MEKWIYEKNMENTCRYTLGIEGERVLICCGINPSTAVPNKLDNTVRRVDRFARDNGYDGYVMINIYPQISTDPANIHKRINNSYHRENLDKIEKVFKNYREIDFWCGWGTLIETRKYFKRALEDIYRLASNYDINWVHFGELTKKEHPRHPLYLRADSSMFYFDMEGYLRSVL